MTETLTIKLLKEEAHLCKEELLALKSEIDKILDWW